MAGLQWSGGKLKGAGDAKAKMRHDDKEERLRHEHSNPDIDTRLTPGNFSYRGLRYAEKCRRYDEKIASLDAGRQSSGKNARVTMQSIIVYAPRELPEDQLRDWYMDAGRIFEQEWGDAFVDMDVHVDEVHSYVDPVTKQVVESRVHGHAMVVPEVDGKLNGKQFASRENIRRMNDKLHQMSLDKYHVPYMTGEGKHNSKSVAQLKAESIIAAAELREKSANAAEQRAAEAERQLKEQKRSLLQQEIDIHEHEADLSSRKIALYEREAVLNAREIDLNARISDFNANLVQEYTKLKNRLKTALSDFEDDRKKALDALSRDGEIRKRDEFMAGIRFQNGSTALEHFERQEEERRLDLEQGARRSLSSGQSEVERLLRAASEMEQERDGGEDSLDY